MGHQQRTSKATTRPGPASERKVRSARTARGPRLLLVLAAIGLLARVMLALASVGSGDAFGFFRFALEIERAGLIHSYQVDGDLNHPPAASYWTWAAYRLSQSPATRKTLNSIADTLLHREEFATGGAPLPGDSPMSTAASDEQMDGVLRPAIHRFTVVLKAPVILADCVAAWLLWHIWRRRGLPHDLNAAPSNNRLPPPAGAAWQLTASTQEGLRDSRPAPELAAAAQNDEVGGRNENPAMARRAAGVAAAFAWSLCSILVSGYHCNTDPIYALLCLACVYCLAGRRWHFLGGLALGAAINVKLTPVLLIVPLLLTYRRWKDARWFVGGLALGALPFLPLLFLIGPRFYQNALAYNSKIDRWGIPAFLIPSGDDLPLTPEGVGRAATAYNHNARYLVFAAVIGWGILARTLRRWDRYEVAAVAFALSLVLTGGFGVQYTVILVPLLFAIRPTFAFAYATAAGLFIGAVYFVTWTGDIPLFSYFHTVFPAPTPVLGLIPWLMLIWFVFRTAWRPAQARQMLQS